MKLSLAALGVVYGDIGTSPLYALAECFNEKRGLVLDEATVLGVLSIVFWSIVLVVAVKYLTFVMRADNHGDGGIMALLALIDGPVRAKTPEGERKRLGVLVVIGVFATALMFGDAAITPAVSVLGAMEGLGVATHALDPYVVWLTTIVLVVLFVVQSRGTGEIARVFGPVMLLWFVVIAALGLPWIAREPRVLMAVDPEWAIRFFATHGYAGFLLLGAAFLCITGAEALYADMGHFGRSAIRRAWYGVAMPALLLNYFGQGALLLAHPEAARNPFFEMAPSWGIIPLVVLGTIAASIASQALISGSFSLAQQAVALGYLPRLTILHTSSQTRGQIYITLVNVALMVGCIALVFWFGTASRLAGAYGMSIVGTMTATSILLHSVARHVWNWPQWKAGLMTGAFLALDVPFLVANCTKFLDGAYIALLIGGAMYLLMSTWKRGRAALLQQSAGMSMELFLDDVKRNEPARVDGTALFMSGRGDGVPVVLSHFFKHCKSFHKKVVLLTLIVENTPRVALEDKLDVTPLGQGFYRVIAHYGYMESPNVPRILQLCRDRNLPIDLNTVSYFLGRETILPGGKTCALPSWRKRLFGLMSRNARPATAYFGLPPNRVVELGSQVAL